MGVRVMTGERRHRKKSLSLYRYTDAAMRSSCSQFLDDFKNKVPRVLTVADIAPRGRRGCPETARSSSAANFKWTHEMQRFWVQCPENTTYLEKRAPLHYLITI